MSEKFGVPQTSPLDDLDKLIVDAYLSGDKARCDQLFEAAEEFYEFSLAEVAELKMLYGDDFERLFCSKPAISDFQLSRFPNELRNRRINKAHLSRLPTSSGNIR